MTTSLKWKYIKIHSWNIAKHVNWYFVFAVIILSLALIMGTAVFLTIDTNHQLNPLVQFQSVDRRILSSATSEGQETEIEPQRRRFHDKKEADEKEIKKLKDLIANDNAELVADEDQLISLQEREQGQTPDAEKLRKRISEDKGTLEDLKVKLQSVEEDMIEVMEPHEDNAKSYFITISVWYPPPAMSSSFPFISLRSKNWM